MDQVATFFLIAAFVVPGLIVGVGLARGRRLVELGGVAVVFLAFLLGSLLFVAIDRASGASDAVSSAVFVTDLIVLGVVLLGVASTVLGVTLERRRLSVDADFTEGVPGRAETDRSAGLREVGREAGTREGGEIRDDGPIDESPVFTCESRWIDPHPVPAVDTGVQVDWGLNTYVYRFKIIWGPSDRTVSVTAVSYVNVYPWYVQLITGGGLINALLGGDKATADATGRVVQCRKDPTRGCLIIAAPDKDSMQTGEASAAATVNITPVFAGGAGVAGGNFGDSVMFEATGVATVMGKLAIERIKTGITAKGGGSLGGNGSPGLSAEASGTIGFDIVLPGSATYIAGPKSESFTYSCERASAGA